MLLLPLLANTSMLKIVTVSKNQNNIKYIFFFTPGSDMEIVILLLLLLSVAAACENTVIASKNQNQNRYTYSPFLHFMALIRILPFTVAAVLCFLDTAIQEFIEMKHRRILVKTNPSQHSSKYWVMTDMKKKAAMTNGWTKTNPSQHKNNAERKKSW